MGYLLSRSRAMAQPPPANNWLWIARLPIIPGAPAPYTVVAEGIDFQHRQITAQPRFAGATHRHYPTMQDVGSFNMSFYETEDYTATQYLTRWQELVMHPYYGSFGLPREYKKDVYLEMYNITNQKAFSGRLMGAWPTGIGSFNMTYNESGRLIVNCAFACNYSFVQQGASASMMSLAGLGIRTLINGAASLGSAVANALSA